MKNSEPSTPTDAALGTCSCEKYAPPTRPVFADAAPAPPSSHAATLREIADKLNGTRIIFGQPTQQPWADALRAAADAMERLEQQNTRLKLAVEGLVGASTRAELEQMELGLRIVPGPAEDKTAAIDAVHALLALLPPAPETE